MGAVTRCQLQVFGADFNAFEFSKNTSHENSVIYVGSKHDGNVLRWHSNWEKFNSENFSHIEEMYREETFLISFLSQFKNIKSQLDCDLGKIKILLVVEFSAKLSHSQRGMHMPRDLIKLINEIGCSLSWSASCSRKWLPSTSKAGFRASYKEFLMKSGRARNCQN